MLLSGGLLTSDNTEISYLHYKNGYDKVIIVAHGFFNSKDSELLQELAAKLSQGYDVFMFDFRGHGKSNGLFTWTSSEDEDLLTVLNYIKGKYKQTGLIGFSLGGSISINVLAHTDLINSFICVSAPSDFHKIDYKFWELNWENDINYSLFQKQGRQGKGVRLGPFWLPKTKPLDSVKKIKVPALYIHGDKDWVIKPWHSEILHKNTLSRKKLVIIKDGPHAEYLMRKFSREFISEVKTWLEETLKGGI